MSDSDSNSSQGEQCLKPISKLQVDENIAAYLKKRLLERDQHIAIHCNDNYIESIVTNYVIAKQILSHIKWQEKLIYRHVCSAWNSAVNALRREHLSPVDFSIRYNHIKQSSSFSNEPLAVFTFMNIAGFPNTLSCKNILPSCCDPPCDKNHLVVDAIHKLTTAPKECMMGVKAPYVTYLPQPRSKTKDNKLTSSQAAPFIAGIYIPVIPNVKFHLINLKDSEHIKQEFSTAINNIVKDQVIKGLLVFVTDKHFLNSVEDIVFLHHVKDVQPDIPYAMGGCICEDTICDSNDINHFVNNTSEEAVSDNLISIGIFAIPKNLQSESNFDMFSLVIKSSKSYKQEIHESIAQFSKSIPHFKHSVCFKFACINRDMTLKFEQDTFRNFFPDTPLLGCYVNGELGLDHPTKPAAEWSKQNPKRFRESSAPRTGIIDSYTTVFVYLGWGKKVLSKG